MSYARNDFREGSDILTERGIERLENRVRELEKKLEFLDMDLLEKVLRMAERKGLKNGPTGSN